jgi:hypothetical protein
MRAVFAITFLICSICVRAQIVETSEYVSRAEGKVFHSTVSREQLLKTPVWRIEDDHPPLSPRAAERAAKKEFEKWIKNTTQWTENHITLDNLDDTGDKIHWVYLVHYRRFANRVEDVQYFTVIALMDGTVVEPTVSDAK